ncbi:hypothetical protein OG520_35875 [Streptomyces sp. NBC_00984]|uniref:hypothetical protein n=1 Tax=Streptomyces sp. NBC_00984 TaxID=2903700 RepID=UPI00386BB5C4|nr:hypothetical protein OG520_35875 [Streptomyces sp. NBC_00984]
MTGAADAVTPNAQVAYEVPLVDDEDEPVTAPLALGWHARSHPAAHRPRTRP